VNRRVAVVVAGMILVLAAATVRVPTSWFTRRFVSDIRVYKPSASEPGVVQRHERWTPWEASPDITAMDRWAWVWALKALRYPHGDGTPWAEQRLDWRILAPTHTLILLLGGSLMTWVVRRERWRGVPGAGPSGK